jgi:hypothetical protein
MAQTKTNVLDRALSKITGRKPDDQDEATLKAKLNRFWEQASGSRKNFDWKWFMYDLWVSGNHYAKWNKNTQQITTTVKEDGRPKVVINKVYTTLRAVRNYTVRNRPKAEVTPANLTEETVTEAIKINKYLDFLHDKLQMRRKIKGVVWNALKYSTGYWQVLWNEDADDSKGEIEINEVDTYDLYWDPVARFPSESRYCFLAVRRVIEDLKNDSKYEEVTEDQWKRIPSDKQLAASNFKARLIQHEKGGEYSSAKEDGTVIVKECWIKEVQKDKSVKMRIVTMAGGEIIRDELTELDRFPFFKLASDVESLSMYAQGWVKNLIPPNKLLDRLESSLAEYNELVNKGRFVSDKGAGVRVINNEHGQIIEKKRGYEVAQMPIAPLSAAIYTQIENVNRYIEDIGGAHDASLGRIPPGAKSGRALEALQVGDSNNLSELVENLEEFLEEVYEYILYLASQKYQFVRNIIPTTSSGERQFIQVIGEAAANKPAGAVVIPAKNMVDVKITSWLAHTAEARQETLKELYQLQAIDQQTLLEGYEIGSIADIIQRTKEQQKDQMAQQLTMQKMGAQAQQQATQTPPAGPQQAIASIRSILTGQPANMPQNVTPEFLDYIDQFMTSQEAQQLPAEAQQAIQTFRDQVAQMVGGNANGQM